MRIKDTFVLLICLLIVSSANTLCSAQADVKKYEDRKNVKKLILILQDGEISKSDRKQAAWALGRLKDTQALDPLIEALNDDDLRKASVWALGDIGGEKASDALVSVLTDASSPEKEEAVMVHEIVRDPNKSQVSSIWYNAWTGNPTKEFEWDPKTPESGNFYRYNSQGEKYLFAQYFFKDPRRRQIDIMERDGSIKERILLGPENSFSTKIHEDSWEKWVEWPQEINWASERLKFLEADIITSGGRLFGK